MISLVNKSTEMENNPPKLSHNNSQEAAELLGFSSSDSIDSPSFSHFQAPKQKRKVRFKKPFRANSRTKHGRNPPPKNCNCRVVETAKILSYFSVLAIVGALLWYVMSLSQRIQELQNKFADIEAGNRNTPEALHLTHSKLRQLDSNVTMLFIEVRKNIADIDNITLELKHLKDVTNDLKESLAAAPALQELPKNVHALSESVANFGSKMNALESNLKELKDQQSSIQTTAQNLSGELDSMKVLVQELTNSSDVQSKSSLNSSNKDVKLQSVVQETNQHVHVLEGKLMNVVQSIDKMNSTLSVYSELPAKVETINEAIVWITNDTRSQNSVLHSLENFIVTNVTLRLEQLEAEAGQSLRTSVPSNLEYINKTISETILHLINKEVLHVNPSASNLQPLEQTHDLLVLLAALLRKFEQIPKSYILSNQNATELVRNMLHQAFEEMMASRDLKIQEMELDIKNLTSCIPLSINTHTESKIEEDLTTLFQPAAKDGPTTRIPSL